MTNTYKASVVGFDKGSGDYTHGVLHAIDGDGTRVIASSARRRRNLSARRLIDCSSDNLGFGLVAHDVAIRCRSCSTLFHCQCKLMRCQENGITSCIRFGRPGSAPASPATAARPYRLTESKETMLATRPE